MLKLITCEKIGERRFYMQWKLNVSTATPPIKEELLFLFVGDNFTHEVVAMMLYINKHVFLHKNMWTINAYF